MCMATRLLSSLIASLFMYTEWNYTVVMKVRVLAFFCRRGGGYTFIPGSDPGSFFGPVVRSSALDRGSYYIIT